MDIDEIPESLRRAQMATASINDLPDSAFAYIEPGGKKDASGKTTPRSLRHFPIHDAAHVRNALARAPQSPFGEKAMPKIRAAAKKFGIDVGDNGSSSNASRSQPMIFHRSFPLLDMEIQRGGDGRTVEAYAAVFHQEAEIRDGQGHYLEVIEPTAFNRAIGNARPSAQRAGWGLSVFFNHGKDLYGNPAAEFTKPIGVPIDVRADEKGLVTVTRYSKTPLADDVLQLIRDGAITGQSFTGGVQRSQPEQRVYKPSRDGQLTRVRRLQLGLLEYGPTPVPAYEGAGILSVRHLSSAPDGDSDQALDTDPDGADLDDTPRGRSAREVIRLNRQRGIIP